jgi:Zn-dependent protease with chaperone function
MRVRSTTEYLIAAEEIEPGWALLYAVTFALQSLCASVRALAAFALLYPVHVLFGESLALLHFLSLVAGYGPLVLSLGTLILPLGSGWWRLQTGGRDPSRRERLLCDDAMSVLTRADPSLRPPRRWFVVDEPQPSAAAYADTLMITRGLLESGCLEVVLAHELGHLNSSDARLTAALHRLTTPPRRPLAFPMRAAGFVASGAVATWVMRVPWAAYWRAREFHADAYAASLGSAEALAGFLEQNALDDDLPVPFAWLSARSHPPTEYRIDRLYQYTDEAGPSHSDADRRSWTGDER